MIFDFEPWKLEIDVEATKGHYGNKEYNGNIDLANKVMKILTEEQKDFFTLLGIDISKADMREYIYDFPEENPPTKTSSIIISFLLCGRFCEIPEFQNKLYWEGDEKIFTDQAPTDLTVVRVGNGEYFPTYDVNNMAVIFKHPFFSIQDQKFEKWECGYMLGEAVIKIES